MSRGQHRSRSRSGSRILERCRSGDAKNTIVIDDDESHPDVVVIDDLCSHHPSQKAQECLHGDVIVIDVEEDDTLNSSGVSASNQSGEMHSDLSSSKDLDTDELFVNSVHRTIWHDHSGPSRHCYGLGVDSECSMTESTSLESDDRQCNEFEVSSSDCEIIEDFSGNIREQWEKAAFRKKERSHLNSSDEDSTSGSNLSSPNIAENSPTVNILTADNDENLHLKSAFNISLSQTGPTSGRLPEEPVVWRKDSKLNPRKCSQKIQPRNGFFNVLDKDGEDEEKANENHSESTSSYKGKCPTGIECNWQTLSMMQASTDNGITNDKNERKVKIFCSSQQKPFTDHGVADIIGSKNIESNESPIISGQQEETMFSTESSNADGNLNTNMNEKGDVLLKTSDLAHASHSETIEMLSNCTSLIGEREKHKQTDEYRQVMEEEWASRQKQLQFQAKEAQLLRKRRKAERIRLLDMEKRQKQRLEEIREIQKKDVETTQIKEQIRIEVRKELDGMEVKYKDMASILSALGINVKGGYFPSLDEVNAACKQALIKFHPDRASRTDIRQQIEAEEKFKLISRLKEKLADSSFGCK